MPSKRLVFRNVILTIAIVLGLPLLGSQAQSAQPDTPVNRQIADVTCQDILTRAMNAVESSCDGLVRNKACYGNNKVTVESNSGAALKFDTVGDRAALQDIHTLMTSPLDTSAGTWGLSLLKVQANLPDSLPGQNITFLLFGDTSIENTSGDMRAFYFTSGLGSLECREAPHDGILVRSPQHTEVTFTANGMQISIASTVLLRAERGKSMSVELIEGHARLTTPAGSQTLLPGEVSSAALGGDNGLTVIGAPSTPTKAASDPALDPMVTTAQNVGDPDAPVNVTLEGCIVAAKGDLVTVDDYVINVGSDRVLKAAKVGDCVRVEGQIEANNGIGVTFKVIRASKQAKPGAGGNANGNGNRNDGNKGSGQNGNSGNKAGDGNGNDAGNNGNGGKSSNSGNNGNANGNMGSAGGDMGGGMG